MDPKNITRYSVLNNNITGDVVIVDGYEKRYDRMRKRIVNWANLSKDIAAPVFYKMIGLEYDTRGTFIIANDWIPNDVRQFELDLRAYLRKKYPGIILYGYAWVGETMPISKIWHYHLVLVTSKRLHFARGEIRLLWKHGFIKVTTANSPFYLVAYVKKRDQKDYFYFPFGARGFAVWFDRCVVSRGHNAMRDLRILSLSRWEFSYVFDNDLDLDSLKDVRAPPSGWSWCGSYYHKELAESKAAEIREFSTRDDDYLVDRFVESIFPVVV